MIKNNINYTDCNFNEKVNMWDYLTVVRVQPFQERPIWSCWLIIVLEFLAKMRLKLAENRSFEDGKKGAVEFVH